MTDVDRLKSALENRYTVERELGAGGMATVYLAHDTKHHRKVAVKVLRPELAASLGADRFHREIEIAAQLQHPHILPLLDSGEAEGVLYYMMPFVEGESVRDRLAKHGELPVHEAVRILVEVVDALAHAHARGVVHRDIKPDNIMLSGRHALVTDFGVAKAVSEATGRQQLTTAGIALGTPSYMAPEQATADPNIDHRVDIYAVGCLAYELLTGRPPFSGLTPTETLAAQVTIPPEPVNRHRTAISAGLTQVVMRCLEKRPADRWQSANELLGQLEQYLTPSTGMTPAAAAPAKRARRRATMVWGAGIVATIVVAGISANLIAGRAIAFSLGQQSQVTFEPGLEIEPAISPDGRYVAYAAGPLGAMRIYVRQVGGRPVPVTAEASESQRGPAWSPDGTQLLFRQGRDLMIAPAIGGVARVLVPRDDRGTARSYAWSPDGRRVAFTWDTTAFGTAGTARGLYVTQVQNGVRRLVARHADLFALAWSPDGRRLAFSSGNPTFALNDAASFGNLGSSNIYTVSADSGPVVAITTGNALNVSPAWTPEGDLLFVSNRDGSRDVYGVRVRAGRARGAPVRLTSGLNAHSVSLSADGKRVAYSVYTARSNIFSLPIVIGRVQRTADAHPITTGNQLIEGIGVSTDGSRLYYDSDRAGNPDIYRIDLPAGEPLQLTNDPAPDFGPTESFDGKWIAFHSLRRGSRDLFLMPAAGGEQQLLRDDPEQEFHPVISPDGSRIVFWRPGGTFVIQKAREGIWGAPKRIFEISAMGSWLSDSSLVVPGANDEIIRLSADGDRRDTLYRPPQAIVEERSGQGSLRALPNGPIVQKTQLGRGRATFSVLGADRRLRVFALLDDPLRPASRSEFAIDGRNVYFTLFDRQSDIYVADLVKR